MKLSFKGQQVNKSNASSFKSKTNGKQTTASTPSTISVKKSEVSPVKPEAPKEDVIDKEKDELEKSNLNDDNKEQLKTDDTQLPQGEVTDDKKIGNKKVVKAKIKNRLLGNSDEKKKSLNKLTPKLLKKHSDYVSGIMEKWDKTIDNVMQKVTAPGKEKRRVISKDNYRWPWG